MANFFVKNDAFFGQPFFKQTFFTGNAFFQEPFFGGEFGGGGAIAKPDKVTGLGTTGVTKTEIQLDWDAMARAADYNISVIPSVTGFPKTVSVNSYGVQGLTAATAYTFKVKACNVTGCGAETQKTETTAT